MNFALDTSIISHLWRWDPLVRARLEAVAPEDVAVPSVALAERVYGMHHDPGAAQKLPDRDLMIAATCLAHGCVLVTHNLKDFERIQELTLVDWLRP